MEISLNFVGDHSWRCWVGGKRNAMVHCKIPDSAAINIMMKSAHIEKHAQLQEQHKLPVFDGYAHDVLCVPQYLKKFRSSNRNT